MRPTDSADRRAPLRRRAPAPGLPTPEPAADAAAAPAPRAPRSTPAPEPAPHLDADALQAELAALRPEDLAALLGAAPKRVSTGDEVRGRVVRVGREGIFVDVGDKSEGVLDLSAYEGEELPEIGQRITAYVLSTGERGIRLARRISSGADLSVLESALEARVPVDGVVDSRNKGGFVIKIGQVRAFCPVSHISRLPQADLDSWIGQRLDFLVVKVDERDVVVSRRALEEAAAETAAASTWEDLAVGQLREAVVSAVREYGAFVDVGGVRGLIPTRELGWDPAGAPPAVGSTVTARITHVDRGAGKLALSLKDPDAGPWSRVGRDVLQGGDYRGKVVRLTEFGAFIRLSPGLEGLAPLRALSDKRVGHPSEVVQEGQDVVVRVMAIDLQRRRLELSLKDAGDPDEPQAAPAKAAAPASFGTMAQLFQPKGPGRRR